MDSQIKHWGKSRQKLEFDTVPFGLDGLRNRGERAKGAFRFGAREK